MGLLSHKWRELWRSCCLKVVFTRATMSRLGNKGLRRTRTNFAWRVDTFLWQLCSPPPLNKFVVKFGLRRKHKCHVDRWVRFCAASGARHITFDFTPGVKRNILGSANGKYIFRLHVFSDPDSFPIHTKSLHLGYISLYTTTGFPVFANLKKLTLHKVSILCDIESLFLPECAALEWLSVSHCSLSGWILTSRQPLHQLRYLQIHYCYLERIELEAPNLRSFDLINWPIPFALGASTKVMEAKIKLLNKRAPYGDNLDHIYTELPAALPHVQKLSITSQLYIYDELHGVAKSSARFINLKHLTLCLPLYGDPKSVGGIFRLGYLLELAPCLEELELHFHFYTGSFGWALEGSMLPYPHPKLKRVLMSGACNWVGLMDLAYYILRSASRLECMIMDPSTRAEGPPLEGWMLDLGRESAKKLLERKEFQGILTIL